MRKNNKTFFAAFSAVTAAAYAVMTIVLAPISYGPVQLRVSELLCILPFFIPESVWGLFLGCLLANLITGNLFDIVFGSLATLAAAILTAFFGKRGNTRINRILACLMPVLINALVIGAVVTAAYNGLNVFRHAGAFVLNAGQIALGEGAVLFLGGLPLIRTLPTFRPFQELLKKANAKRS